MGPLYSLPPELWIIIFDELRPSYWSSLTRSRYTPDDTAHPNLILSSCALVCKSWYTLTRPQHFHSIGFTFAPDISSLVQYEKESHTFVIRDYLRRYKTLEEFSTFLRDSPHCAQHITVLSLHMVSMGFTNGALEELVQFPSPAVFLGLLTVLSTSRLRHVKLQNVALRQFEFERYPSTWIKCLPSIETLYFSFYGLDYGTFTPQNIHNTLSMFSAVKALAMERVWAGPFGAVELGSIPGRCLIPGHLQATNLELRQLGQSFRAFIPLNPHPILQSLRNLQINFSEIEGLEPIRTVNALISACAARLEEFHFDLYNDGTGEQGVFLLDLSHCTALRTLMLAFSIDLPEDHATWLGLTSIATHGAPPNLQRLNLLVDERPGRGQYNYKSFITTQSLSFEKALANMRNLSDIVIMPFVDDSEEDHLQVESDVVDVSRFCDRYAWVDPRWPLVVFAGLICDGKVWVGGKNSIFEEFKGVVSSRKIAESCPEDQRVFFEDVRREGIKRAGAFGSPSSK